MINNNISIIKCILSNKSAHLALYLHINGLTNIDSLINFQEIFKINILQGYNKYNKDNINILLSDNYIENFSLLINMCNSSNNINKINYGTEGHILTCIYNIYDINFLDNLKNYIKFFETYNNNTNPTTYTYENYLNKIGYDIFICQYIFKNNNISIYEYIKYFTDEFINNFNNRIKEFLNTNIYINDLLSEDKTNKLNYNNFKIIIQQYYNLYTHKTIKILSTEIIFINTVILQFDTSKIIYDNMRSYDEISNFLKLNNLQSKVFIVPDYDIHVDNSKSKIKVDNLSPLVKKKSSKSKIKVDNLSPPVKKNSSKPKIIKKLSQLKKHLIEELLEFYDELDKKSFYELYNLNEYKITHNGGSLDKETNLKKDLKKFIFIYLKASKLLIEINSIKDLNLNEDKISSISSSIYYNKSVNIADINNYFIKYKLDFNAILKMLIYYYNNILELYNKKNKRIINNIIDSNNLRLNLFKLKKLIKFLEYLNENKNKKSDEESDKTKLITIYKSISSDQNYTNINLKNIIKLLIKSLKISNDKVKNYFIKIIYYFYNFLLLPINKFEKNNIDIIKFYINKHFNQLNSKFQKKYKWLIDNLFKIYDYILFLNYNTEENLLLYFNKIIHLNILVNTLTKIQEYIKTKSDLIKSQKNILYTIHFTKELGDIIKNIFIILNTRYNSLVTVNTIQSKINTEKNNNKLKIWIILKDLYIIYILIIKKTILYENYKIEDLHIILENINLYETNKDDIGDIGDIGDITDIKEKINIFLQDKN